MIELTRDDILAFAPKAHPAYVDALLSHADELERAGILDSELRLCHFMTQVGAETNYLTILRESLDYRTPDRLRQVWPARFRNKSDAQLRPLLRNPVGLGDEVYGGRMGNDQPGDGYAYRGGGWIQTTGKSAVQRYARRLGMVPSPALLDDHSVTLQFACLEWTESKCNRHADENDILRVSKAINVGSAESGVMPNGMAERRRAFDRAWAVWGDRQRAPDADMAPQDIVGASRKARAADLMVKGGAAATAAGGAAEAVGRAIPEPSAVTDRINETSALLESAHGLAKFISSHAPVALIGLAVAVVIGGYLIRRWTVEDYREGRYRPRVGR